MIVLERLLGECGGELHWWTICSAAGRACFVGRRVSARSACRTDVCNCLHVRGPRCRLSLRLGLEERGCRDGWNVPVM